MLIVCLYWKLNKNKLKKKEKREGETKILKREQPVSRGECLKKGRLESPYELWSQRNTVKGTGKNLRSLMVHWKNEIKQNVIFKIVFEEENDFTPEMKWLHVWKEAYLLTILSRYELKGIFMKLSLSDRIWNFKTDYCMSGKQQI